MYQEITYKTLSLFFLQYFCIYSLYHVKILTYDPPNQLLLHSLYLGLIATNLQKLFSKSNGIFRERQREREGYLCPPKAVCLDSLILWQSDWFCIGFAFDSNVNGMRYSCLLACHCPCCLQCLCLGN